MFYIPLQIVWGNGDGMNFYNLNYSIKMTNQVVTSTKLKKIQIIKQLRFYKTVLRMYLFFNYSQGVLLIYQDSSSYLTAHFHIYAKE